MSDGFDLEYWHTQVWHLTWLQKISWKQKPLEYPAAAADSSWSCYHQLMSQQLVSSKRCSLLMIQKYPKRCLYFT